jgi:hypothetical protein
MTPTSPTLPNVNSEGQRVARRPSRQGQETGTGTSSQVPPGVPRNHDRQKVAPGRTVQGQRTNDGGAFHHSIDR